MVLTCSGSLEDAYRVEKKQIYGATNIGEKVNIELDIDELKKQMDMVNDSPYRINELFYSHPIGVRRLFAEMEFAKCETLYAWRPDLKKPGLKLQTKAETDENCKKIIGVLKEKEWRK